jgi:sensor domain CHASE-containing protein
MKLRTKLILVIFVGFSILCFVLSIILNTIIIESYSKLESKTVIEHVGRVLNQISEENNNIEAVATDWSVWDETYFFVENKNDSYIQNNLLYEIFEDIKINFMLFYNNSGALVFSRAYDFQVKNETLLPASLYSYINNHKELFLNHEKFESNQTGIILYDTKETPLLISITPILHSNRDGPVHGSLIIGRFLDDTKVESFGNITHLTVLLHSLSNKLTIDFEHTSSFIGGIPIVIKPINSTYIVGYVKVNDIFRNPVFLLEIGSNRDIYNQGLNMIQNLIISLIITAVMFIVIVVILLDRFVSSRLTYLAKSVNEVKEYKDLSKHLQVKGNDEIASLEKNINDMLSSLQITWAMKDSAEVSLQKKINELERFKTITVDREIKMIELKKDNNTLKDKIKELEDRNEKEQTRGENVDR